MHNLFFFKYIFASALSLPPPPPSWSFLKRRHSTLFYKLDFGDVNVLGNDMDRIFQSYVHFLGFPFACSLFFPSLQDKMSHLLLSCCIYTWHNHLTFKFKNLWGMCQVVNDFIKFPNPKAFKQEHVNVFITCLGECIL